MTELQQNRNDQLLRRVGDLKGGGSKVSEVLSEVFPVFDIENMPAELLALAGWRTAWQSTERPVQATQNSASQLRNPAGSGLLVVVTQVAIRVDSATFIQMEVSDVLFGTPVAGLFRDARFGVPRNTAALVSSADNIPVGGGLRYRFEPDAPSTRSITDENGLCVLTPGTAFNIGTITINRQMTVNYFWRERVAEPSEVNF